MDEEAKKRALTERTICRKGFNTLSRQIQNDIDQKQPIDLINKQFEELKIAKQTLKQLHAKYLVLTVTDDEDDTEGEDAYLQTLEMNVSTLLHNICTYRQEAKHTKDILRKQEEETLKRTTTEAAQTNEILRLRKLRDSKLTLLLAECDRASGLCREDDTTASQIQSTYADLKEQLSKISDVNDQLICKLSTDDSKLETQWLVEKREEVQITLNKLIEKKDSLRTESLNTTPTSGNSLQIPKLPMPKFSGNIRQYPRFKREFNSVIVPKLGTSDPAYVLRSCLEGEPQSLTACISDDVDAMWKRLDELYGDPSKVVDVIMNEVQQVERLEEFDHKGIVTFIDLIESANADLKHLNMDNEINNAHAVGVIEAKLPRDLRLSWSKHLTELTDTNKMSNKFPHLLQFLLTQRRILEYADSTLRCAPNEESGSVSMFSQASKACVIHQVNGHTTAKCRNYSALSARERVNLLSEHRLCFNCLKPNHTVERCTDPTRCEVEKCGKQHHNSLHEANREGLVLAATGKSHSVLLQLMNIQCGLPKSESMTVLWDSAAEFCLITFSKAQHLGLVVKAVRLSITKVGGEVEVTSSFEYKVPLRSKDGKVYFVEAYGIETISSEIRQIDVNKVAHLFPGTQLSEIERPSGRIELLVGYNYAPLHPNQISNPAGNLVLVQNIFGKCLGGSHQLLTERTVKHVKDIRVHFVSGYNNVLDKFIKGENMGVSCWPNCGGCACGGCSLGSLNCTIKEQRELEIIESNLEHAGDHWETTYPWLKDPKLIIDNRRAAESILRSTERRISKNDEIRETFNEQMTDLVQRCVARKLSEAEIEAYDGPTYYLSCHEVVKKESTSTPFRIVFSSKQHMGQVLNDFWAKGPDLLNNPLGIVIRFREEQYALLGDIRKMYHSIKLKPGVDQHTHRFLWRNCETDRTPDVYVLTTVTFGDRPAGSIAATALKKTAELGKEQFPEAATIIDRNIYVDDIADSFKTNDELELRKDQLSHILKQGGFHIKEWITVGSKERMMTFSIDRNTGKFDTSILGLKVNAGEDRFVFKVKLNFNPKKRNVRQGPDLLSTDIPRGIPLILTKKLVLAQVNGIWDPQGLSAPIVVKGKINMRNLWIAKLGWDETIPPDIRKEWEEFFIDLFQLETISFQRCLKPKNAIGNPILVISCDGSEDAYGAVAYVQWKMRHGGFESRLIMAKCKIAPMRKISVVRLELNGALLGARLKSFITKQSRYEFEQTIFIVDSKVVHAMLKLDSHGFQTYPALRIGEIQEVACPEEWVWIDGHSNIADILTRKNAKIQDLNEESNWQRGMPFMKQPIAEWPILSSADEKVEIPEMKTAGTVSLVNAAEILDISQVIDFSRFSSFYRLKRITAWVIKACNRFKGMKTHPFLTRNELLTAEKMIVTSAQRDIITRIEENRFRRLCARIEDGIVVVGGRAERWLNATWNRQTFILLLPNHHISEIITRDEDIRIGHLGVSATIAAVRSNFWIVKIYLIASRLRKNCVDCRKKMLDMLKQKMADLPIERLKPCPPFTNVGCDYCGPFTIKGEAQKRIHSKCFGVIIVCMVSRAVYADITTDYSTDSFLLLIRRFGNRHGWPAKIFTDSGSQLKGASEELKKVVDRIDRRKVQEQAIAKDAEWHFVPPEAPWMNGVTESLVKSIKKAMSAAIGSQILSYSELQTVMFECAELVNERPIGRTPTDPDDGSYLCPNDLILGRSTSKIPQGDFDYGTHLSRRFRFVQSVACAFWKKWTRDFFPSLLIRSKWHVECRNVKVGDVVLLKDSNALRGTWRLALVTQTMPNEDGLVRRIMVQCKQMADGKVGNDKVTELERATHNVIVLVPVDEVEEVSEEEEPEDIPVV